MEHGAMKDAFLEAFDSYGDAIFRFCMVKVSNKELAEDLTQETFTRYWQALRDGKYMTNTRSYLYTIANNLVIDWYRKKKDAPLDTRIDAGFEPAAIEPGAEESAAYKEVLSAMEALEEGDREVLLLRYVEGLEPKEIAEALGESANVISVRINRAVKRLQKQLHV